MKKQELRDLIREEIHKVLNEDESFGDMVASNIEKQIRADILKKRRAFMAWAKNAAKKKRTTISFQGPTMIWAALRALERIDVLNQRLLDKWESSPAGSPERDLYDGLESFATQGMKQF